MSKFKDESFWVSHTGITLMFTLNKWTPFKALHRKLATYLIDSMVLVTTYDAKKGTTGDIKSRVWEKS